MCCCIPSEPIEDKKGRPQKQTFPNAPNKFQTDMINAPIADCPYTCFWFMGQFLPVTCGLTQYMLRSKFLEGDMSKYICFQGVYGKICCCITPGQCGEKDCPCLCLCTESYLCNGLSVSATRIATMQKFDLRSDPCDYRLIYISNALFCLSFICDILALINNAFNTLANIIDLISEIFYHTVSGCMTAQVAHELNYQLGPNKVALVNNEIIHGEKPYEHQQSAEPTIYPTATAQPVYSDNTNNGAVNV